MRRASGRRRVRTVGARAVWARRVQGAFLVEAESVNNGVLESIVLWVVFERREEIAQAETQKYCGVRPHEEKKIHCAHVKYDFTAALGRNMG